jgi:hypothetical protein
MKRTSWGSPRGFRPGRSQHQALDALWVGLIRKKVNGVLDADIRDFFGSISHEWLGKFIEHRIADRRILRLMRKWLRAGVSEEGGLGENGSGDSAGSGGINAACECVPTLWCARIKLVLPAGEIPAPTRGAAASSGIESWVGGGNESDQA